MSVATAGAAVSTQHHQPTAEQIRLAQLIDNKKHNDPEVQKIIRKVLDVVENSNQEDALVALFDCDYDYEKAVALLIEKGHDIANEWRTATNHKVTKKQQQQKGAATKNGHEELSENGQQRGNNNSAPRGKTRGGRSKFQQNGGDSHNATTGNNNQQQNDNDMPQQRQRGGSGYRGRNRGNPRGSFRGTDRNYQPHQQQQTQDSNVDASSPSDTNRRNKGAASNPKSQQDQWDVGNWNGETLIISRTTKDEEQQASATADSSSVVHNGQSDVAHPDQSTTKFDFIEAARQIKDVIGIGQAPKSSIPDQQQKSKATGQPINTKVTPPPPSSSSSQPTAQTQQRIPHQPVIFSDHFDGGMHKIDVQFGNLGESYDDASAVSTAPFYQPTGSIPTNKVSQQRPMEQSAHISPSTRSTEQPVMNQQRILLTQVQQPAMAIKSVVPPQYTVHPQQHQANTQNMLLQSLLFHQQQQPEPVTLDASYDPNAFPLSSLDFSSPYIMAAMNAAAVPQQQTQARYMVPQPPPAPQQTSTKTAQTQPVSTTAPSTGAKKAPAVPPGMFPSTVPPPLPQTAYPTPYGVQQQTGGPAFSAPYDAEHLFTSSFMQLNNSQQTQSPTGGYGSVTPPVQQHNQPQQTNSNNDSKAMGYRGPVTENLMLMQQLNLQQTNSQQHGQQAAAHSPMNFFLGHPAGGSNYSSGPQLVYAPAAAAAMTQQQPQQFSKQQGQQYNQHNSSAGMGGNEEYYGRGSSSSNKEGQYIYATATQPPHISAQSAAQQHGVNKQQHQSQRTGGNVYNNQQGQQRPYQ